MFYKDQKPDESSPEDQPAREIPDGTEDEPPKEIPDGTGNTDTGMQESDRKQYKQDKSDMQSEGGGV